MFTIFALAKILGIPFGLLFFGMIMLPDDIYFVVVGGITALIGIAMLFYSPMSALVLIPTGVALIAFGVRTQRRAEQELLEAAERTSASVARMNKLYIRPDDDDPR